MITILAEITLLDEKIEEFNEAFILLKDSSLLEDGCESFGLVERFETCLEFQALPKNNIVYIHERWRDAAAFNTHITTEHFERFNHQMIGIIGESSMQAFEM